jgi:hypothetical protein
VDFYVHLCLQSAFSAVLIPQEIIITQVHSKMPINPQKRWDLERQEIFMLNKLYLALVYCSTPTYWREPGSAVSIVSGYVLDDWAIEVRSPAEAKGLLL